MATDRIIEHIDRLREKPEHVRQRIALATAAGVSGLVLVFWVIAMATSGVLALKTAPRALEGEAAEPSPLAESTSAFSNLVGAAGAAFSATSSEAALRVLETRTTSTIDMKTAPTNNTDKTVIPF